MIIFAGVDGTGVFSDRNYWQEFRNSFVSQFYYSDGWDERYYLRGPSNDGLSTGMRAQFMTDFVLTRYYVGALSTFPPHLRRSANSKLQTQSVRPSIFLCGYSRGGAAAIKAAWHLHREKIQVDCLLLFDAVDRTNTVEGVETIPPNVSSCYHAVRDPMAMSRYWFGNCGRTASPSVNYVEQTFFCTHGGVGGLPWSETNAAGAIDEGVSDFAFANFAHSGATNVTPAMDAGVSQQVWGWMNRHRLRELANCRARIEAPGWAASRGLAAGPSPY